MAQATADAPPADGLVFGVAENGRRSSTATTTHVFAAALEAVDPDSAEMLRQDPDWRHRYPRHIRKLVTHGLQSTAHTHRIADAGLHALYSRMWFLRDGVERPLPEAMTQPVEQPFHALTLQGSAESHARELAIPYHGRNLTGDGLLRQIEQWEQQGIVEPSHAHALREVMAHPEWLDLSDQTVVLLGAGAEMGPLRVLSQWQANLVAVDVARPAVWGRILQVARSGNGTLTLPLRISPKPTLTDAEIANNAGADLLRETPEIAAWLADIEGPLTVGCYAYLDGEKHVRVSLAMDAIATALLAQRRDVGLAYLLTPTDAYAVSAEAAQVAQERYEAWKSARMISNPKLWQESLHLLSGGRFFQPNVRDMITAETGQSYGVVDALVVQQGANYALAKRLQQWRATLLRRSGVWVSANVAPATTTHSVVKNAALAAAYEGADRFQVEVFHPATSNALMAALLVYDLRSDESASNSAEGLAHPLELFMQGANHNGLWRTGFSPRSVLEIAAILGWRAFLPNR